jgi:hypothetical protein
MSKLWEYNNFSLFEADVFHHCPYEYKSWDEFIKSEPFECNCISGNPLLYWYWDNNDNNDDNDIVLIEENFKRIVLIL